VPQITKPIKTKPIKVLWVEDCATEVSLLGKDFFALNHEQIQLKQVQLREKGLNPSSNGSFDLAILNLSLDYGEELNSVKRVKQFITEIPIIVLANNLNPETEAAVLKEGVEDYLIKNNELSSQEFTYLLLNSIANALGQNRFFDSLDQQQDFYQRIVEEQSLFICRFDIDGTILFANRTYCQYLGTSFGSLTSQNFFLLIYEQDFSLAKTLILSLSLDDLLVDLEFRGNREQELRWQKWDVQAVVEEQTIVGYQAVGKEIGSIHQYSAREKESSLAISEKREEKFRVAVNSTSVFIWLSDVNDDLTFANQFWLEFTGKNLEVILQEDWLVNLHSEDRRASQILYQNAFRNREYFDLECRFLNHRGEYRWFFITGVPRFDLVAEFLGFVWSGVDISKQKQVENLLKRQARRNYILAKITRHIHESLELATILQTTTEQVNHFLKAERIIVGKIESVDNFKIWSESTISGEGDSCKLSPFLDLKLWQVDVNFDFLTAGEIIFLDRLKEDNQGKTKDRFTEYKTTEKNTLTISCSAVVVPIRVEQQLWGVICVEHLAQVRRWKLEEVSLLEQITTQLEIAIKQAELYQSLEDANQQLQQLTVIDSLTGIANRRRFDEYLTNVWNRLAREKACLSLILCDVDYFKLYNDSYGHLAGDSCLQKIAEAIQKTVKRSADLVARYGGEEIAIILPNTSPAGARALALDIRQSIQALQIPHLNSTTNRYVTLSLGVAGCVPQHKNSAQCLIEEADRNLYQAKENGRNRVVGA